MKKIITIGLLSTLALIPSLVSAGWGTYPGCTTPDITLGEQVWASCNVSTQSRWSTTTSGWYLYGKTQPIFTSENGSTFFAYQKSPRLRAKTRICAPGYHIPSRYDWEALILNLRRNNESLTSRLTLPLSGAHMLTYDSQWAIYELRRLPYAGTYLTSTSDMIGGQMTPFVLHLSQFVSGYLVNSTDMSELDPTVSSWVLSGWEQVRLERSGQEIANVRCIRDTRR